MRAGGQEHGDSDQNGDRTPSHFASLSQRAKYAPTEPILIVSARGLHEFAAAGPSYVTTTFIARLIGGRQALPPHWAGTRSGARSGQEAGSYRPRASQGKRAPRPCVDPASSDPLEGTDRRPARVSVTARSPQSCAELVDTLPSWRERCRRRGGSVLPRREHCGTWLLHLHVEDIACSRLRARPSHPSVGSGRGAQSHANSDRASSPLTGSVHGYVPALLNVLVKEPPLGRSPELKSLMPDASLTSCLCRFLRENFQATPPPSRTVVLMAFAGPRLGSAD